MAPKKKQLSVSTVTSTSCKVITNTQMITRSRSQVLEHRGSKFPEGRNQSRSFANRQSRASQQSHSKFIRNSETKTVSSVSRAVHIKKQIKRTKCSQCAQKTERIKNLNGKCRRLSNKKISLSNQIAVYKDWKETNETVRQEVLSHAAELDLRKLMESGINPSMIEAELLRRGIPRYHNIWSEFETLKCTVGVLRAPDAKALRIKKRKMRRYRKAVEEKARLVAEQKTLTKLVATHKEKFKIEFSACNAKIERLKEDYKKTEKLKSEQAANFVETMDKLTMELNQKSEQVPIKTKIKLDLQAENTRLITEIGRLEKIPTPGPCEICPKLKEEGKLSNKQVKIKYRAKCAAEEEKKKIIREFQDLIKENQLLEAEIKFLVNTRKCTRVANIPTSQPEHIQAMSYVDSAKWFYDKERKDIEDYWERLLNPWWLREPCEETSTDDDTEDKKEDDTEDKKDDNKQDESEDEWSFDSDEDMRNCSGYGCGCNDYTSLHMKNNEQSD